MHERAALHVLKWLHYAENALLGNSVATFSGEAGVIKAIRLDDSHGLCFSFDDPVHPFDFVESGIVQRFYPVSTIKHKATDYGTASEVSKHNDGAHRGNAQARRA